MAILFDPLIIDLGRKFKIKRQFSAIIVLTVFFVVVFVAIYFSASMIIKQSIDFAKDIPSRVQTFVEKNEKIQSIYGNLSDDTKDYIMDSTGTVAQKAGELGTKFAGSLFGVVKNFPEYFVAFIIFMVAVYIFAIELPKLKPKFLSVFDRKESREKIENALNKLKFSIVGFLKSQVLLSFLTFLVTLIGLVIIGADYAIVMAIVIVVVDLLPVLGTGSVLVPWAIYCFLISNVPLGVGLLILFVVITAFRRIVEPKLIGDSIGLSPLATLISLYIGFKLLGVMGMILGPVIAIVVITLKESGMIKINIKI